MSDAASSMYFELQRDSKRVRPGHDSVTQRAFELLPRLQAYPRILDLACGTGQQSIALARISRGHVTAVDTSELFLNELKQEADRKGLSDQIRPVLGPADGSSLEPEEFDVVWSEGGVQSLGLETALTAWSKRLAVGGSLVLSDLVWLKSGPPLELASFLRSGYPQMRAVNECVEEFEKRGLDLVSFFIAGETAWWDEYLNPLEMRITELRPRYQSNATARALLDNEQKKIDFRKRFPDFYGLVYFVARPYAH